MSPSGDDMVEATIAVPDEEGETEPEHLVLLVNGFLGYPSNWRVVYRNLANVNRASKLLLVASNANLMFQTIGGIDYCGKRLARELQECIDAHPSLAYISVIGHSMGALVARYSLGRLYDPKTRLIGGLKPRHFISLASPHLGCEVEGVAEVPLIGWPTKVPYVGDYATRYLRFVTRGFASIAFRRTGRQFFLIDGTPDSQPLLLRMTEDGPGGHFFSALQAFASRTCYANSYGDWMVGWANASLRHPDDLPTEIRDVKTSQGVVREDPLRWGMEFCNREPGQQSTAAPQEAATDGIEHRGSPDSFRSAQSCGDGAEAAEQADNVVESSAAILQMLQRLQSLPWCRIDTSFRGTTFPLFAHNLIQVTREWINWEGESVVQHLAKHFSDLEDAASETAPVSKSASPT